HVHRWPTRRMAGDQPPSRAVTFEIDQTRTPAGDDAALPRTGPGASSLTPCVGGRAEIAPRLVDVVPTASQGDVLGGRLAAQRERIVVMELDVRALATAASVRSDERA